MNQPDPQTMDESGFIKTYDQYNDKIFRHLYYRFSDREKALDLMQETFMKTFVYLKNHGNVENIQAFLYKVANNLAIDEYKKHKTHSLEQMQEEQGFTPSIDESDKMKAKIDANSILEIIGKIPAPYQTVIIMRYVDELSVKEMAKILGESENSISVKIHRGIAQVRKFVNK